MPARRARRRWFFRVFFKSAVSRPRSTGHDSSNHIGTRVQKPRFGLDAAGIRMEFIGSSARGFYTRFEDVVSTGREGPIELRVWVSLVFASPRRCAAVCLVFSFGRGYYIHLPGLRLRARGVRSVERASERASERGFPVDGFAVMMMTTRNARGCLIDNGSNDPRVARVGLIIVDDVRAYANRRSAGYRSVKRGMTVVLGVIFCFFKRLTLRRGAHQSRRMVKSSSRRSRREPPTTRSRPTARMCSAP